MDTDNKEIKAEDLIALRDSLKSYLSKLDCRDIKHRQLAINAIELYVKKYVMPAMHLSHTDIDGAVGEQITGLGLGVLFDSERKDLSRPSDEEINEVFYELTELKPTQQLRDVFWTTWLVREAVSCIRKLCNFLEEPLGTQISTDMLTREIKQLQQILKLPMTGIRANIEILLEKEKEALFEWKEKEKEIL